MTPLVQTLAELTDENRQLRAEVERLRRIGEKAVGNARILAHAYKRDCRPPALVVLESAAYPVRAADAFEGEGS